MMEAGNQPSILKGVDLYTTDALLKIVVCLLNLGVTGIGVAYFQKLIFFKKSFTK